jgi:hypothetical protein
MSNELIPYTRCDTQVKPQVARLAMSMIVMGKRDKDIITAVERDFGIAITNSSIAQLRRRDDVRASIMLNDREALQSGIASRANRIAILDDAIELLFNTFVVVKDGKKVLKIDGQNIRGGDAVAAVKVMGDLVKVATEMMEPKNNGMNVQVNTGNSQVANFGDLLGIGPNTDVVGMLQRAAKEMESKAQNAAAEAEEIIDVDIEDEDEE